MEFPAVLGVFLRLVVSATALFQEWKLLFDIKAPKEASLKLKT